MLHLRRRPLCSQLYLLCHQFRHTSCLSRRCHVSAGSRGSERQMIRASSVLKDFFFFSPAFVPRRCWNGHQPQRSQSAFLTKGNHSRGHQCVVTLWHRNWFSVLKNIIIISAFAFRWILNYEIVHFSVAQSLNIVLGKWYCIENIIFICKIHCQCTLDVKILNKSGFLSGSYCSIWAEVHSDVDGTSYLIFKQMF